MTGHLNDWTHNDLYEACHCLGRDGDMLRAAQAGGCHAPKLLSCIEIGRLQRLRKDHAVCSTTRLERPARKQASNIRRTRIPRPASYL